jgi:hypothetical protein
LPQRQLGDLEGGLCELLDPVGIGGADLVVAQ